MGGTLSSKHSKITFATPDGSVGITPGFAQKYARHMPFDIKTPVLTPRHVELIKANWSAVCAGTSAFDVEQHGSPDKFFHRTFYATLFKADPSLRGIFRSSLTLQGKSLASIIKVMTGVVSASNLVERMQALASGHLKFGVKRQDYATLGVTLIQTLEIISGSSWSRHVKEAYLTAYCLLFYLVLPVVVRYAPDPVQDSIPCAITNVDVVSSKARRLTLAYDFPLRFQPGDGILLGSGHTQVIFPIASFHDRATSALDICVDVATSDWLCRQAMDSKLKLFWVASNVNFEIDTPDTGLPTDVLLISYGIGAAPFVAMMQGLHSVKDSYRGRVVALQCAPTFDDIAAFQSRQGDLNAWDQCSIHYASKVTAETFLEIAPNSLDHVDIIVNGPKDFVTAVAKVYVAAGGRKLIRVYGFDNPRHRR